MNEKFPAPFQVEPGGSQVHTRADSPRGGGNLPSRGNPPARLGLPGHKERPRGGHIPPPPGALGSATGWEKKMRPAPPKPPWGNTPAFDGGNRTASFLAKPGERGTSGHIANGRGRFNFHPSGRVAPPPGLRGGKRGPRTFACGAGGPALPTFSGFPGGNPGPRSFTGIFSPGPRAGRSGWGGTGRPAVGGRTTPT